jgi:hypothetical protein
VTHISHIPHIAVVSRCDNIHQGKAQFLQYDARNAPRWIDDPQGATAFESMREATRAAIRLPAGLRAYSLPWPLDVPAPRRLH